MSALSVEDKIELLKNLLADPNDWISAEILRLNAEAEPEANLREPSTHRRQARGRTSKSRQMRVTPVLCEGDFNTGINREK